MKSNNAPHLPEIDAGRGDLAAVKDEAWQPILEANDPPSMFQQGHLPVRIEHDENGDPRVVPVDVDRLRQRSAEVTNWHRWATTPSGKKKEAAYPPRDVMKNMLATPDKKLPGLTRIVGSPIFGPDGSIRGEPGYDAATRTYFAPAEDFVLPPVADEPTVRPT